MSVKQIKWHVTVLTVTVIAVLAAIFMLATVTSNAADVVYDETTRTYTMSDSTYDQQIMLEDGETTTIHLFGDNKVTSWDPSDPGSVWCINGGGNLKITGKGDYTGTIKRTFKINPKGTSLKKPKKGERSKTGTRSITVKWKKQAQKMSGSRITGYQIQLATNKEFNKNKKTVTIKGYRKVSKKVGKLKAGKTCYVRIRTYTTVGGKKYYSPWSKVRSVKI